VLAVESLVRRVTSESNGNGVDSVAFDGGKQAISVCRHSTAKLPSHSAAVQVND
jgi:hypothetical protein